MLLGARENVLQKLPFPLSDDVTFGYNQNKEGNS